MKWRSRACPQSSLYQIGFPFLAFFTLIFFRQNSPIGNGGLFSIISSWRNHFYSENSDLVDSSLSRSESPHQPHQRHQLTTNIIMDSIKNLNSEDSRSISNENQITNGDEILLDESLSPIFFIYPHQHQHHHSVSILRSVGMSNVTYELEQSMLLSLSLSENFSPGFVGFSPGPGIKESCESPPWWLQITSGAVVCVEAEVVGDVRIGTKTIIHPCAKIVAKGGPIVIGDFNIIEELATIVNWSTEPMVIGNNNVFEVGSTVMAKSVGDHNVFETKCFVGEEILVPSGCVFGAETKVGTGSVSGSLSERGDSKRETMPETSLPDNSVFFGDPLKHRIAGEKPAPQSLQIDFLTRILPNYHHIKIPTLKKETQE